MCPAHTLLSTSCRALSVLTSPSSVFTSYVTIMLLTIEPLQLQGWGGVDLMHLKANIKVLTSGQMGTFLVSRRDLDTHVDRLVEVRRSRICTTVVKGRHCFHEIHHSYRFEL